MARWKGRGGQAAEHVHFKGGERGKKKRTMQLLGKSRMGQKKGRRKKLKDKREDDGEFLGQTDRRGIIAHGQLADK